MPLTHFFQILLILYLTFSFSSSSSSSTPQHIHRGFSLSPNPKTTSFQPFLTDPTANFSLGFLRRNHNHLVLAILHVSSSQPFWLANPTHFASWSHSTRVSFNGTLLLSDPTANLFWSTASNGGDTLLLRNTSNLVITTQNNGTRLWQSFDIPTNTLVQDQNFTTAMSLVSPNGLYSLKLGNDFMGLYVNHAVKSGKPLKRLMYWKRTALEAKAEIEEGQGPIYARVNTAGYLGMYQTSSKPVDVQKFNTFQQTSSFLMVRLEHDGNLRGYYWTGSSWVVNYEAISETCNLPNPCGSYGLCTPGGSGCECLDNRTRFESGGCSSGNDDNDDDLCMNSRDSYFVLRRSGVEPPNKELLRYLTTLSLEECEGLCEKNCSCWGALYNKGTGFCYVLDYPVQTMVRTGDGSKVGYFKVRKTEKGKNPVQVKIKVVVTVITILVVVSVIIGGIGIWMMRMKRRKRVNGILKDENGAGPYKNLESASFRSIEMCNSQ
ncbi:unnamed protein product [Lupinus luteus]|uniref:Uncharacterized protein n=1 Tax=Lupinus luteus TaxID=3873 RepID=A0AAV1XYW6_LUPLU